MFECLCELDQEIRIGTSIRLYKVQSSLMYLILTFLEREHRVKSMIFLTQEAYQKVQKDNSMPSERKTSHQKDCRRIKRIKYLKSYVQKGEYQKGTILKVSHSQNFFCTTQGLFSKFKYDITRSKRSADKSEKLVNHQGLFSSSVIFSLPEKESTSSLFSLRPVD